MNKTKKGSLNFHKQFQVQYFQIYIIMNTQMIKLKLTASRVTKTLFISFNNLHFHISCCSQKSAWWNLLQFKSQGLTILLLLSGDAITLRYSKSQTVYYTIKPERGERESLHMLQYVYVERVEHILNLSRICIT